MLRTRVDGSVTLLQLDRPDRANAYNLALLDALDAALRDLSTPVVVLAAMGDRAFCAGADLTELGQADPLSALDLRSQRVFDALARHPAVSICAVDGAAIAGGCELTLACDLRIAGPRARFALPETRLGLIPAAGGCTRLPRIIGPARAKQMILFGDDVDAPRALGWGLVSEISADPLARAMERAHALTNRDPVALRLAKAVIDADSERSLLQERIAESLLYHRKS